MINRNLHTPVVYILLIFFYSCTSAKVSRSVADNSNLTTLKYRVEEAKLWTDIFKRNSGWFGADGIFAVPLNGKENISLSDTSENMIWFSDSMVGDIVDGKPKNSTTLHNTVAFIKGGEPKKNSIQFHWDKDGKGEAKTVFTPHTPSSKPGDYYWLGDGFVNTEKDNTTYIFAYRMHNIDSKDDWSFRLMGTNVIAIPAGSRPPFKNQRQFETPLVFHVTNAMDDGSFGAGIFVNIKRAGAANPDGYVYVYGVKGKEKNLVVARVLPKQFEELDKWRFWDGKGWSRDMRSVASLTSNVSNELSVSPLPDGRYVLVFQLNGMSSTVAMCLGASPVGPFGPAIKLYECPEGKENKNYFTYNAKAHPSLSKPGELLISYNVNSFDFPNELQKNPNLYRPRFIKLKFE